MKVRYVLPTMLLTASCTQHQITEWVKWHEKDPVAALKFANSPEIQAELKAGANREINSYNPRWDSIAQCESGGRWDYPPVTNRTGTYSGGLMIWTKAWPLYGGREFAEQAYLATKMEQIIVAERILADQGWDAWDCA